jgi:hypothetical protein
MQCPYTICSCFELLLPCIFWKEISFDLELGGGCEDMVNSGTKLLSSVYIKLCKE